MASIIEKCGWSINTTPQALGHAITQQTVESVLASRPHPTHVVDSITLSQQLWSPCTGQSSLQEYFTQSHNGPLLRTLCDEWHALGSPLLEGLGLLTSLASKQEESIGKTINAALSINQPFLVSKPFETFASQVGVFASLQAELQAKRNPLVDKAQAYHENWKALLKRFDMSRSTCKDAVSSHLCLGYLTWGEAYLWPLSALEYSFLHYSMQNDPNGEHQKLKAWAEGVALSTVPTTSAIHSSSFSLSSRSRPSSSSAPFTDGAQSIVLSPTLMNAPPVWPSPPQSVNASLFHIDDPVEQKPLFSSIHLASGVPNMQQAFLQHVPGTDQSHRNPASFRRRPALTHFLEHGWEMLIASIGISLVPQERETIQTPQSIEPLSPFTLHHHLRTENDPKWLTRLWSLRTNAPVRAYSIEVSPKGTFAPRQYQFDVVASPLRPHVRPEAIMVTEPKVVEMEEDVEMAKGKEESEHESKNEVAEEEEEPEERKRKRRTIHDRSIESRGRCRLAGRLRSQRHHARLMQQRSATFEMMDQLRDATRMLWSKGCAHTQLARAMMNSITSEEQEEETLTSRPGEKMSSLIKERKRQSKKRLRNVDQQNVLGIACASAALLQISQDDLKSIAQGSSLTQTAEQKAQQTIIDVWTRMQPSWPDLVLAEKRLFSLGVPKGAPVASAIHRLQSVID